MTWIVGGLGPTYAYMVSDLRVFAQGKPVEEFAVQKVLRLTETAVVGVAGNFRIGLDFVETVWHEWTKAPGLSQTSAIPLEVLMFPLATAIEREYVKRYSEAERALGCELLVLSMVAHGPHGAAPRGFLFRCPLPGDFPIVEHKEFAEPVTLTIGFGAEIGEYAEAIDLIPDASYWEAQLGPNPAPEDLMRIPLHVEKLLQDVVTRGQRDHNEVGPILVSTLITSEGLRWATLNEELPFMVRGRKALNLALDARARGVPISSNEDFDKLQPQNESAKLRATIPIPSGEPGPEPAQLRIPEELRRTKDDNGVAAMWDGETLVLTFWADAEQHGEKVATARANLNVRSARDVIRILQQMLIAADLSPK